MKKKSTRTDRSGGAAGEMAAALAALARLDARVVERCPGTGCAMCSPASTRAA